MSVNLYNKNTKELTMVAGNGIGVAKFGTPIENWLVGHSSTATAITADRDGILYYVNFNADTSTPLVATLVVNGKSIRGTRTTGWSSAITLPIRKGDVVYVQDPLSGDQSMFYPFIENVIQPIEGGEEYSTDEKVIGTWIDGKKLYRKVAFISNFTTSTYSATSLGINNVDTMVNVEGFLTNSTYSNIRTGGFFASGYSVVVVYKSNGDFQTELRGFASGKFTLIAEYTKTTD